MHSTLYADPSRLQKILNQTLSIVAYTFLYIFASGIACLLGVALSRLYDKLLLRTKWRGFSDWDSTTQSVCALLAVLGFLITAECLFALHFSGRVDLEVTEQIAVALFGITVFGLACTGVLVLVALLREGARLVMGRFDSGIDCHAIVRGKKYLYLEEEETDEEDEEGGDERRHAEMDWDLETGGAETGAEGDDEEEWESEPYRPYTSIKMRKMPFVRDLKRKKVAPNWLSLAKASKKGKGAAHWATKVA